MGLPGSGKTTLARQLAMRLDACHFEADKVREMFNDWDFSELGRRQQMLRMNDLCKLGERVRDYQVADFVCPTHRLQDEFKADYIIFMDTIKLSRYSDTNRIFEEPLYSDFVVRNWNYDINEIVNAIIGESKS